jgi:hypothetical protein
MQNLALTYKSLKKYEDALLWQSSSLQFFRSVLPENHPDIGKRYQLNIDCRFLSIVNSIFMFLSGRMIGNLASTYCALGDKKQTVLHLELTLQFFQQNLPDSHPDTGNVQSTFMRVHFWQDC